MHKQMVDEDRLLLLDKKSMEDKRSCEEDATTEGVAKPYETTCWGCGQQLYLVSFARLFKCAWCGAITNNEERKEKQNQWMRWNKVRDWLLMAIVLIFFTVIVYGGIWAVFPLIFFDYSLNYFVHSVVTIFFALNVLFNYIMAASISTGPPLPTPWGSVDVVVERGLEGYRFCTMCKIPKAPRVHHCSTCYVCVQDLDHHCPFIGNCVGAKNMRYFLLFLVYTLVGTSYALCLILLAGFLVWPSVIKFQDGSSVKALGLPIETTLASNALNALISAHVMLSIRALVLIFLTLSCLSILVGVSVLLYHQLYYIYQGHNYLESIQVGLTARVKKASTSAGWCNLIELFGTQHPLLWILPRLDVPSQTGDAKNKAKRHAHKK